VTYGFKFSFFRWRVLPEPLATATHLQLQRLANRGVPLIRSLGSSHLVLARRLA